VEEVKSIDSQIVAKIQIFLDAIEDRDEVADSLRKLAIITRKSPASRFISASLERTVDTTVAERPTDNESIWFASLPVLLPYTLGANVATDPKSSERLQRALGLYSSYASVNLQILAVRGDTRLLASLESEIPFSRLTLYESYAHFNGGDYEEANAALSRHEASVDGLLSPRTLGYQYELYRRLDEPGSALNAFVLAYLNNNRAIALYSVVEFADWAVQSASVDQSALDRAILLHAYSQNIGPNRDGDLSDACEDVLDYFDVNFPHQLATHGSSERIRYFLRYVATVDRLEDTTRFDDVDSIEAERIRVLQWLVENDAANRSAYTQEIASITKDQEVARLTAQFERSKIYIHEDGLRRKIRTEYEGPFERYRQILSEPALGNSLDLIEQKFRKILKDDSSLAFIIIPSMERQALFHTLIQRIYDLLVLDPSHGFKTYLSTRILHGVLEGELRASFVSEDLLAAVDSEDAKGDFERTWQSRLLQASPSDIALMAAAGVRFSSRVQAAISELKDERIRVWNTDEYSRGLFQVSLDDNAFERLRKSVTSTTGFEEFIDRVIAAFWESVELCLRDVVVEINGSFRKKIDSAFDNFETALSAATFAPVAGELKDALARCRSSFAHDLARISAWFVRGGNAPDEPFSLPVAVQVATLITNNCYPRHPLAPTFEGPSVMLTGPALSPLVDLLTNCLQNVAEHALFPDNAADVSMTSAVVDGGLRLTVRSSVSDLVDVDECRSEISRLLTERDSLNPQAVSREGKTGIRKMKRILQHDLRTSAPLQIEVTSDKEIVLQFLIPKEYVVENTHH